MPAAVDRKSALVVEPLRRFLRRNAFGHLVNLLAKTRPQDFPALFEALNERERVQVFRVLADRQPSLGAEFLSELPAGIGPAVLREIGVPAAARLIAECAEDDAAALLAELDEEERAALLAALTPEDSAAVQKLLVYDEETAGRIMTPEVFALTEHTTVSEAIAALQSLEDVEMAFYVYVVDDRRHLVGVLSLRELLLHPGDTPLREIMNTDLISVRTDTDQEEVARIAAKYDLLAIPVVDEQGRLVGMVTIDDVVDVLREEATEDIFRMAGTSEEERIEPSILKSARTRSPWLAATLLGGVLAAFVIAGFEETSAQLTSLAAFLPGVLGLGGSAGNQTAIVLIRGLATGRIREGVFFEAFRREVGVAVVLGLVFGAILGSTALLVFWREAGGGPLVPVGIQAAVVGLALWLAVVLSAVMGSVLPLALHKIGIDPAVSTTPFVTTLTDVGGSVILFGLASLVLPYLR